MKKKFGFFLAPVLITIGFVMFVQLFFPGRSRLEFDGDEGLNLMRGLLVEQGYPLYDEVWSDQPPVLPFILAGAFRLFGYKVGLARLLITLFAGVLLGSIYQFMTVTTDRTKAILAVIAIILLPEFLRLSVSVMIGLPALSLAAVSMMFIGYWHRHKKPIFLYLSAIILAFSVQTKLFTVILAPIFVLGAFISAYQAQNQKKQIWKPLAPALTWSLAFIIPNLVILFWLVGWENIPNLYTNHLTAATVSEFEAPDYGLWFHLREAAPVIFLGLVGSVWAARRKDWLVLYPAFWGLLGFVFLSFLSPIWYHHQLLLTIPAAAAAAYAVHLAGTWVIRRGAAALAAEVPAWFQTAAFAGLVFLIFWFKPPGAFQYLNPLPTLQTTGLEVGLRKENLILSMIEYAPQTNWIVTDKPMYAFRARLPVPPFLATLSRKRLLSGEITEQDLIDVVRQYRPEQVLLARFDLPQLENMLAANYVLEDSKEGDFKWYLRSDISDP